MKSLDKIWRFDFRGDETLMLQIFNVFRQLAVIIGSVLIARSALSLEEIGIFESLVFLGFVVSIFWYNGLFTSFLKVSSESSVNARSRSFSALITVISASLIISFLVFLFSDVISFLFNLPYWKPEYNFFLGYLAFQTPIYFTQGIFIIEKRRKKGYWLTLFYFLSYLFVFALHFSYSFALKELLQYLCVMSFFQFLFAAVLVFPLIDIAGFNVKWVRNWIRFALPLLLYSSLGSFSFIFDNWLVNWYYNDKSVYALFRYGARELPLVQTFIISLGSGMIYKLSTDLQAGLSEIKRKTNNILKWLVPLLIILVLSSPYIYQIVLGESFRSSAYVFNIYLLLLFSRMIYSNIVIISLGRTKWLNAGLFIELILNFILSFIFIEYWGITGVAIATVVAFFAEKLVFMYYLRKKHQLAPGKYLPSEYLFLATALVVVANLFIYYYSN